MLRCLFCNRDEKEVKKLVAGPGVYICDECVKIAMQIIESPPPTVKPHRKLSIVARIWRRLFGATRFAAANQ